MGHETRYSSPKPALRPELEEKFNDIDRRSAECYDELDAQLHRFDVLILGEESHGMVAAEAIGDSAVHHLRVAARSSSRLVRAAKRDETG